MKYLLIVLLSAPLMAAPVDISDAGCPSQLLDSIEGQLTCVVPVEPEPEPDPLPDPIGAACPVQPVLVQGPQVNGAYFYDCGEATQLRSPDPTRLYWHIGGGGTTYGTGMSMCISPGSIAQEAWRYPNGNVTFANSDQRLILDETISGNLTVNAARLDIDTINGKFVAGDVICGPNASNVSFNGECICP